MLRNVNDLRGFAIHATDGVIGEVDDFYFDDEDWTVRYLIVDTGGWLSGRKVLVSPYAVGVPDWDARKLPVSLTKEQVQGSPDIDTQKPVSRQHEAHYSSYYGYPYYWGSEGLWGLGTYPGILPSAVPEEPSAGQPIPIPEPTEDAHLRSCGAVNGYDIQSKDGDIGRLDDVLLDDQSWALRYLIVNTGSWWGGHRVLISPQWVDDVSWADSKITVSLTREAVQGAPTYDPAQPVDREREEAIYRHYGRPDHWPPRAARHVDETASETLGK